MPSGQWSGSERKSRLPPDWDRLRRVVLERDGYRCRALDGTGLSYCGRPATDVDHVRAGDDHRLSNLQSLCSWHHRRKSAAEGVAARREIAGRLRRPPEAHPGQR